MQSGQVGHMICATISDTKNRLSELLAKVHSGETLIIVDRKTPVARVERIEGQADNPYILPSRKAWKPAAILSLPIFSGTGASLTDAVKEERGQGW
jgi:antitoxin (DNA-binding transcriptional repressor) of toxin-antitoxin stability system